MPSNMKKSMGKSTDPRAGSNKPGLYNGSSTKYMGNVKMQNHSEWVKPKMGNSTSPAAKGNK